MAKNSMMTWVPKGKRWMKKYDGKNYSVSCRQLGVEPATEKASRDAANLWWVRKKEELDAADLEATRANNAAAIAIQIAKGVPLDDLAAIVLGEEQYVEITEKARQEFEQIMDRRLNPPTRDAPTLGKLVEDWATRQDARALAGEIDHTRAASYRGNVAVFVRHVGADTPIASITPVTLEEFHGWLLQQVGLRRAWVQRADDSPKEGVAPRYAASILQVTKMFVEWLADRGGFTLPRNLRKLKIKLPKQDVRTFSLDEIRQLLDAAGRYNVKLKLWILLMLNIGGCQNDISELDYTELDTKRWVVTRPRSKVQGGPVVSYKLWPEVVELLTHFRNQDEKVKNDRGNQVVLTTANGKLLVQPRRVDNVRSAYRYLCKRAALQCDKPLMLLRKTGATLLARHKAHRAFVETYLAHAPRTVADTFYVRPSPKQFWRALAWLRRVILRPAKAE
jgi:integrase